MPDIQHSLVIDAPADRVLALVGGADGFVRWWAEDAVAVGGGTSVELGFFNRATVYRLVRVPDAGGVRWRCETGQEWAGTSLLFRAVPQGAQTRLEFAHEAWAERTPYFVSCNTVWGHLMFVLKDAAEHGAARPFFTRSGTAAASAAY